MSFVSQNHSGTTKWQEARTLDQVSCHLVRIQLVNEGDICSLHVQMVSNASYAMHDGVSPMEWHLPTSFEILSMSHSNECPADCRHL